MERSKFQEDVEIIENINYKGDYYRITFSAPEISAHVQPGQFVHVRIPHSPELLLRRPFSVFNTDPDAGALSLIYKIVGRGSREISTLRPKTPVNILGPLGNNFPSPDEEQYVIIVAGGYGCASTYLVAKNAPTPGVCLLGGRSRADILVVEEFKKTGFAVRIATNDGSRGHKGLVTELLQDELAHVKSVPAVYACGPNAMLKAVGLMCLGAGLDAYLSFDLPMCCGVGACFTCVTKVKAQNDDGWEYLRTCKYGPVLRASKIYWENGV
jgi:dihydroorotate dehydrogenase electron transfer subunit